MKRSAVLIAILMMFSMFAAYAETGEIAVRVGNISYTVEDVQGTINSAVLMYLTNYGSSMTDEQKAQLINETIESYVQLALIENESVRLRIANFDDNDIYTMREQAQNLYDQSWQEMREQYSVDEVSDVSITRSLEMMGITVDAFYEQIRRETISARYLEKMGASAAVTDEEMDAFYQENYVKMFEERYESNIPLYEEEVLYGEEVSLYTPTGYRVIRQMIIPISDEAKETLAGIRAEAEEQLTIAGESYEKIANLAIAGEDVTEERERYNKAMDAYEQLKVAYTQARAEIIIQMQDTVDEIYGRLATGEQFTDLIDDYSTENANYYWHAESTNWPDELTESVNTLNDPGDVGQPVLIEDDLHILYYEKDLESGAMKLSSEMDAIVRTAAQSARDSQKLTELLNNVRENYTIETHPELLTAEIN